MLRLAIAVFVGQPKRLTMQTWPTTAGTPFGGAIHHALLSQADQQVSVHFGVSQGLKVIATIQRHHWPRCTHVLGGAHRGILLERDLGGRCRRRSATLHVQRQHPTVAPVGSTEARRAGLWIEIIGVIGGAIWSNEI